MNIKEIELNNDGRMVACKGTFTKDKVYLWAKLGLDYCGG